MRVVRTFLVVFLLIPLGGCSVLQDVVSPLPSDEELTSTFGKNHEALLLIVKAFRENPDLHLITKDAEGKLLVIPNPAPGVFFSAETASDYLQTLDEAGCRSAVRHTKNGSEIIYFSADERYIGTDADGGGILEEKGFAYSSDRVDPTVDSLDSVAYGGSGVFRSLAPNWYLYRQTSVSKPE